MKKILIIGATSAIAGETARLYANQGAQIVLVGRNPERLAAVANDLEVRGANKVTIFPCQLTHLDTHPQLLEHAIQAVGVLDAALIAHGSLPDQRGCEQSVPRTVEEFTVNCLSVISLATLLAAYFEKERRGCLAVISSVAGDRGRQNNYVYGAAKGAVSLFLQGLRNRLSKSGVSVITIKPGFVETPMTASVPRNFLFAQPARVARDIHRAMETGRDVVYTPWFWRWIMLLIRWIPERFFKRLNM